MAEQIYLEIEENDNCDYMPQQIYEAMADPVPVILQLSFALLIWLSPSGRATTNLPMNVRKSDYSPTGI